MSISHFLNVPNWNGFGKSLGSKLKLGGLARGKFPHGSGAEPQKPTLAYRIKMPSGRIFTSIYYRLKEKCAREGNDDVISKKFIHLHFLSSLAFVFMISVFSLDFYWEVFVSFLFKYTLHFFFSSRLNSSLHHVLDERERIPCL